MKILFAPSEGKRANGDLPLGLCHNFCLEKIVPNQQEILKIYQDFLDTNDIDELSKWFGIKNLNECQKYKTDISKQPILKAIMRYNGVAYEALDYPKLDESSKDYIDKNLFIYSNLFGMLKADDLIPDYKLKQGAVLPNLKVEQYYKKNISDILDKKFENEEILNLSAGHYSKIYQPKCDVIVYKFLKNKKVVSHWAKYFRGELLRQIAVNKIENFEQLLKFDFEKIETVDIEEKKNIKTVIVEIKG